MGDSYCNASKGTDGSEVVCKGLVYGMMKGSRKREQDPCEYGGMSNGRWVIVIIRLPKQQMALK